MERNKPTAGRAKRSGAPAIPTRNVVPDRFDLRGSVIALRKGKQF
jgi:hypothetical protein